LTSIFLYFDKLYHNTRLKKVTFMVYLDSNFEIFILF